MNPFNLADNIISGLDNLFTSDDERLQARNKLMAIIAGQSQLQADINKEEAKHPSLFVSGWRPALGWLCVSILGYSIIGRDFISLSLALAGFKDVATALPLIDLSEIIVILSGLLGLGTLRTAEKYKGVART